MNTRRANMATKAHRCIETKTDAMRRDVVRLDDGDSVRCDDGAVGLNSNAKATRCDGTVERSTKTSYECDARTRAWVCTCDGVESGRRRRWRRATSLSTWAMMLTIRRSHVHVPRSRARGVRRRVVFGRVCRMNVFYGCICWNNNYGCNYGCHSKYRCVK